MGFKYQIIRCIGPEQFMDITMNHLDNLFGMVKEEGVIALLDNAKSLVLDTYSNMSHGNLYLLKQTLYGFFEDRKVKVGTIFIIFLNYLPYCLLCIAFHRHHYIYMYIIFQHIFILSMQANS